MTQAFRIENGGLIDRNKKLWVKEKLDLRDMRRASSYLIGEKDFSSFRSSSFAQGLLAPALLLARVLALVVVVRGSRRPRRSGSTRSGTRTGRSRSSRRAHT